MNINLMYNSESKMREVKDGSAVVSRHRTWATANVKAKQLAKSKETEYVRFKKNGQIRKGDAGKLSYGNDPRSISG